MPFAERPTAIVSPISKQDRCCYRRSIYEGLVHCPGNRHQNPLPFGIAIQDALSVVPEMGVGPQLLQERSRQLSSNANC